MQSTKGQPTKKKSSKISLAILVSIITLLIAGIGVIWFFSHQKSEQSNIDRVDFPEPIYSTFTGLEISDTNINNAPLFCIQIPNGSTDGARPQAGLTAAGVVFEAIAETGITRFAAIFQNPPAVVGSIRSLRPYYIDWDTPFDCTIVHDGGSDEALATVGNGQYRNLDENFDVMWKTNYINGQYRYWNNVFTSGDKLLDFNRIQGYGSSQYQAFPRLTPDDVTAILSTHIVTECSESQDDIEATDCTTPEYLEYQNSAINTITYSFTNIPDYSVVFRYDTDTNTYKRYNFGYDDFSNFGEIPHQSYSCSSESMTDCQLEQIAPSNVVIMHVQESTMADGYHESIQTISNGTAEIFQNGIIIQGTWSKPTQTSQISFKDQSGNEIAFTPGQIWIAAVPQFGSVNWE